MANDDTGDTTQQQSQAHMSPFERIRQRDDQGNEFWSARDLATVLGYTEYGKFTNTLRKAETACENSGQRPSDHFAHTSDMVTIGSGARRRVADVHLSRYACYLVVQNADPSKEIVALGQTYFAVRTREAEIAEELAGMTEAQRRLYTRAQLATHNKDLAIAAQGAGVITSRDFAIFQDHGYQGLYGGETARDIAARKGVKPGTILDHMGSTELAANLFRATQTEEKLRREGITGKAAANRTHHDVGQAVRRFIVEDLGGTPPEQLPTPAKSIPQLQREEAERERLRLERERQPSLFDLPDPDLDPDPDDKGSPGGH
jgi:DNA-damage-inducible protein D